MKKLVLLLAAALLASTQAVAQDNPTVGVINLEQALFNSDAARSLEENTRSEFQSDEQRLERLNTELREIIEQAQRDESILSEQELRQLNADAEEKQVQMQLIAERLQNAWNQRQQQFVEANRQLLGQAIEAVVEEGEYDLVLNAEAVAYFNNSYNITALVTAKINELAP
jgi:outer membrane protein